MQRNLIPTSLAILFVTIRTTQYFNRNNLEQKMANPRLPFFNTLGVRFFLWDTSLCWAFSNDYPDSRRRQAQLRMRRSNTSRSPLICELVFWRKDKCLMQTWVLRMALLTYPGTPPDSIWLAIITSLDHTSKCHFLFPSTPHITDPLWIPILMFKSTYESS